MPKKNTVNVTGSIIKVVQKLPSIIKPYQCNLHQLATNLIGMAYYAYHLFCSYQYKDMHSVYNPRDIYFLQMQ